MKRFFDNYFLSFTDKILEHKETNPKLLELAHKIKKLNAFVACTNPGNRHSPAFMICRKCKKVAEVHKGETAFDLKKVSPTDFEIEESVIELIGVCKPCNNLEAA